ncbi:hypothetical protein ODJ79_09405 [Actinoplanes sp. KI2]|uniref:flavoprotein n=1 Tax=Actinoplanes sp. KI2 TaxID=2983315 RepID=UPI0021D5D9A4|nr:flavoprotein [Actinoplanes sp. KI2]MCU7723930.1 hypothetical protein [Actinoplanes sp. KI2]
MADLPCKDLLIGASGSIHVTYLSQYLLLLRRQFAQRIRVIMTRTATAMVPPATLELYTDGPVYTDLWGTNDMPCPHLRLTRSADLFLVLPASANTLGKAAAGIADDLLSTAILASPTPVLFAPGMNSAMWNSGAVQRNVRQLRDDGHYVIPGEQIPEVGTGDFTETGPGPTVDQVMSHSWHVLMRRYKEDYWAEATSTPPAPPSGRNGLPLVSTGGEARTA